MLPSQQSELARRTAAAVIPARGGSKGIPRKNLALCAGKPLLVRAIATCQQSRLLRGVWVSTEDDEIAAVARAWGAGVIHRPAELATDEASSDDVLLHALDFLPDDLTTLVSVQCTAPLLTAAELDLVIERRESQRADVVAAIAPAHEWQVAIIGDRLQGLGYVLCGEKSKRRQILPPRYRLAGSVVAIEIESFRYRGYTFSADTIPFFVAETIDIDTPNDLALADAILRQREANSPQATERAEPPAIQYPL